MSARLFNPFMIWALMHSAKCHLWDVMLLSRTIITFAVYMTVFDEAFWAKHIHRSKKWEKHIEENTIFFLILSFESTSLPLPHSHLDIYILFSSLSIPVFLFLSFCRTHLKLEQISLNCLGILVSFYFSGKWSETQK